MKAEYSDNGYSRQDKHEESPGQGFSAFKSNYAQTAAYDSENNHSHSHKHSRGHEHGHDRGREHDGDRFKERHDKTIGSREQKLDPNSAHDSKNFLENQENGAEQEESILLFGPRAVLDTLEADPTKVDSVFVLKGQRRPDNERILDLCRKSGVRFSLVDEKALDRLVQGNNSGEDGRFRRPGHGPRHQGVVARLFQAGFLEFDELLAQTMDAPLPLLVALDQVQDPGNVGTLARTIFALGGAGLLLPKHNGVFLGYAALKASAGALAQLPVARVSNLKTSLKEAADQGFTIYGAAYSENANSVFKANLRLPAILVLGSEEKGLRESVEAQCLELLSVPMLREMDSLNVAQSGAIIAAQFLAGKLAGDKS